MLVWLAEYLTQYFSGFNVFSYLTLRAILGLFIIYFPLVEVSCVLPANRLRVNPATAQRRASQFLTTAKLRAKCHDIPEE